MSPFVAGWRRRVSAAADGHGLLVAAASSPEPSVSFQAMVGSALAGIAVAGGATRRPPRRLLLPLPRLLSHPTHRRLLVPGLPLPSLLPIPFSSPPHRLQALPPAASTLGHRRFRSENDPASNDDEAPIARGLAGSAQAGPDDGQVELVCKLVADLFDADRAMDAALDAAGVTPTPALVAAVLGRFRHAYRPAFRFFRWSASHPCFQPVPAAAYTAMIEVFSRTRQFESLTILLDEAAAARMLSMDSLKVAINAFAAAGEMKKALSVLSLLKKHNLDAGLEIFNYLLQALAKAKLAREAYDLFNKMRDQYPPDVRTYTFLLLGFCRARNLARAGQVWKEMLDDGIKPDVVTHNILLECTIAAQHHDKAVELFELMKAKGPMPNVRTYTLFIQDHCKHQRMDLAMRYLNEMQAAGCAPDVATYTCLISGFGKARQMDKVSALLRVMKERGCRLDAQVYNMLIRLMTIQRMPDDAARIYFKMVQQGYEPTIHTYNMMMKSYFLEGNYEMGCAVWDEMAKKGVCPDINSFTVFINGHVRHGRHEEAQKYMKEMISKGMKAPEIDYSKFAADFARSGHPDILYELAKEMNFTGKFDTSNVFNSWAERVKNQMRK